MPAEIQWYMPEHVLLARYYGNITPEGVGEQYKKTLEMSESVDNPLVHLIVDITEVTSFPKNITAYNGVFGRKARNSGWVVLVGKNKIMHLLGTIISNFMKLHLKPVNTLDEALEFIAARDPNWDIEDALDMTIPYGEEG